MKFGTAHDKNKEFIGNITYLGCMKGVNEEVTITNYKVNVVVSGIILIILLINIIAMIRITIDVNRELKRLRAR